MRSGVRAAVVLASIALAGCSSASTSGSAAATATAAMSTSAATRSTAPATPLPPGADDHLSVVPAVAHAGEQVTATYTGDDPQAVAERTTGIDVTLDQWQSDRWVEVWDIFDATSSIPPVSIGPDTPRTVPAVGKFALDGHRFDIPDGVAPGSYLLCAGSRLGGITARSCAPLRIGAGSPPPTAVPTTTSPQPVAFGPGPVPVLWTTFNCSGGCMPPAPTGLPTTAVYADGTYVTAAPVPGCGCDHYVLRLGTLGADQQVELRSLLTATDLLDRNAPAIVPLPDGASVSDGGVVWYSVRTPNGVFSRGIEDPRVALNASKLRAAWIALEMWIEQVQPAGGLQPSNSWMAIAATDVPGLGDVTWGDLGDGQRCALFEDPARTASETKVPAPAGVRLLRPALPHETSCAAVAEWQALVTSTPRH